MLLYYTVYTIYRRHNSENALRDAEQKNNNLCFKICILIAITYPEFPLLGICSGLDMWLYWGVLDRVYFCIRCLSFHKVLKKLRTVADHGEGKLGSIGQLIGMLSTQRLLYSFQRSPAYLPATSYFLWYCSTNTRLPMLVSVLECPFSTPFSARWLMWAAGWTIARGM